MQGAQGAPASEVQGIFQRIAPVYDTMNRLMTGGLDLVWRKSALRLLKPHDPKVILDLAAGTGDFAQLATRQLKPHTIYLVDPVPQMLQRAAQKLRKTPAQITYLVGVAENLPLPSASVDAITIGFGVRNFQDRLQALREMHRVLKKNGHVVILESGNPTHPLWRKLYWLYMNYWVPFIGKLFARNQHAYAYLSQSTEKFPHKERFLYLCQVAGFENTQCFSLLGGAVYLYKLSK
ncbi:MAG: bifunctional demethylmenaquinone methyltransferase/2-methoxy-6-polyprenyl-1,4-benzoquinol methylase UbiE [Bacteroidia bacterium]